MKKFWISLNIFAIFVLSLAPDSASAQPYVTEEPSHCNYDLAEETTPYYAYEYVGSKRKLSFEPGKYAPIVVYIENTGTLPLYSDDSECRFRPVARLGTARERDRSSIFYTSLIGADSGWAQENRIKLDQKVVYPGEQGSFTFWVKIPEEEGIYREYYDIVIEGKQWLDNEFVMNLDVGEFVTEHRDYLTYVDTSRLVKKEQLQGEKSIEVDISSQRMYLKVGEIVIKNYPVSTGTYRTPTPYGHTRILYKQEVRVAHAWPHYIMPKWLAFRAGGYGIHALPSIAFDNGYFWREAWNHIGTRRSHGCIRLLPNDAEYAYDFAEVGMPVWVHP